MCGCIYVCLFVCICFCLIPRTVSFKNGGQDTDSHFASKFEKSLYLIFKNKTKQNINKTKQKLKKQTNKQKQKTKQNKTKQNKTKQNKTKQKQKKQTKYKTKLNKNKAIPVRFKRQMQFSIKPIEC